MAVKTSMLDYAFFEGEIVPFSEAKISIGTHARPIRHRRLRRHPRLPRSGRRDDQRLPPARPHRPAAQLRQAAARRATVHADSLAEVIASLVEKNAPTGDVYIRPFIYKPAVQLTPRLRGIGDELAVYMMGMGDYLDLDRGQKAIVSSWVRIPDNAIPSRGKLTGAYVNSAFIKDEAEEKGADEAIVLNTAGKVAEGCGCNLFMVRNGILTTPPLTSDILEGITRRTIIQFAEDAGHPGRAARDRPHRALPGRGGLLLRHGRSGRLDRVGRRPPGRQRRAGPDHQQIKDLFFDTVRGKRPEYADWLYQVKRRVASAV